MKKTCFKQGFKTSHALGQNFILDKGLLSELASLSCIENQDTVVEIGPGMGGLTCELAKRAKQVFAVEADERLRPYLEVTLSKLKNVSVFYSDVLKLDLRKEIESRFGLVNSLRVAANLPYYITSELIHKLTAELSEALSMALMVQKEVAVKMTAAPGCEGYGPLSLMLQWRYDVQIVRDIARTEFVPVPKVDSSFVLLKKYKEKPFYVSNEKSLNRLIQSSFILRRKTLRNSLSAAGYDKELCQKALEKMNIGLNARAEELTLKDYCMLSELLS